MRLRILEVAKNIIIAELTQEKEADFFGDTAILVGTTACPKSDGTEAVTVKEAAITVGTDACPSQMALRL
jgi:hypothetical protein